MLLSDLFLPVEIHLVFHQPLTVEEIHTFIIFLKSYTVTFTVTEFLTCVMYSVKVCHVVLDIYCCRLRAKKKQQQQATQQTMTRNIRQESVIRITTTRALTIKWKRESMSRYCCLADI